MIKRKQINCRYKEEWYHIEKQRLKNFSRCFYGIDLLQLNIVNQVIPFMTSPLLWYMCFIGSA